jgi:hypothetical protein
MHQKITSFLALALLFFSTQAIQAQTTITQWNFNSNPADASTSTGSLNASVGSGTINSVGITANSFASGSGSSDPITTDNTGMGLSGFPAQGTGNKTAGIQFSASTVGYENISISFDLRHSNTGPKHFTVQYTTDVTATTPVWVDFAQDSTTGGDVFVNNRTYYFSSITALNNNAKAGFRIVASYRPSTSTYVPANAANSYATTGTWRFDMVTVKGVSTNGDIVAPLAQIISTTSSTTSFIKFSEAVTSATATVVGNYVFTPALSVTNASLSATGDTVFLTHAPLVDGQLYTVAINNIKDLANNTIAATNLTTLFNASRPNLVITEIMHSPNDIESIEVYNAGTTTVNLGGLRWTDGTGGAFPTTTLAAGATIVFATAPTTTASTLNISNVSTITSGLGSSNDILVIRNSLNQVVDSVSYFVGTNGWPTAPTGLYGYSFELNSATNDNNIGSNWALTQNPVVPQPSAGVVTATMGVYPSPAYTPTIANVSFVGGPKVSVSETTTTVRIIANLKGGGALPSSIGIEVLPISTATNGSDYTIATPLRFDWAANANYVNDTILVTINNDAIAENAEYFIVRFTNAVNTAVPSAASNHFTVMITDDDKLAPTASQSITLNHIASFSNGVSGTNSAEIVAHDPVSQRLFIANSLAGRIDIVNFKNPSAATLIASIPLVASYGNINSVAVRNGIVAAAIENTVPEQPGKIVFFDTTGAFISQVTAGAMPDMITFDKTGTKVLTANEGQPNNAYTIDPEGSVTIVDISGGVASVTQANVTTASFAPFNAQAATLKAAGVRIFGKNNPTVAQDMEPEYISFSDDGATAYVTCQENNAIAVINLASSTVTSIRPLGLKDHSLNGNALDVSDQGGIIEMATWPIKGVYMPDAIASYKVAGQDYYITANEGDAREYGTAIVEPVRISSSTYVLDSLTFPYRDALKANIGRLNVTIASGDTDGDGDYDEIHAFGARSISIWNATTGALVWDSGDMLELITAKHPQFAALFNASNANNTFKNRSDDKGPEPEGVTIAEIGGKMFAFVALERIGGCMVFDVTNPSNPIVVDYKNTRNLTTFAGDNGAEGIIYISAANSPTGSPIVILANEISSTLSFYRVDASLLDIALTNIDAKNEGTKNIVTWQTATEAKGDMFELERSSNGTNFNFVTAIAAKGTASSYSYTDAQPYNGVNYYRLKFKNVSGSVTYSPIVTATVNTLVSNGIQVYPNPVVNQLTITTNNWQNTTVNIVDVKGAIVKTVRLTAQQTAVDVTALPSGTYSVRSYNGNYVLKTVKITKQ